MPEDQKKIEEETKDPNPTAIDQQAAPSAEVIPPEESAPVMDASPKVQDPEQPATQAGQGAPTPNSVAPQVKTFTQDEVNKLVGQARVEGRESATKAYRDRYGAATDEDLDGLLGNGEKYDDLNGQFSAQGKELQTLREENALLKATSDSGLDPAKYEDVKAILAYQHMDLTPEAIAQAMQTHPEWARQSSAPEAGFQPIPQPMPLAPQPSPSIPSAPQGPTPSVISKLGNDPAPAPEEDEKTQAMRMMGIPPRK